MEDAISTDHDIRQRCAVDLTNLLFLESMLPLERNAVLTLIDWLSRAAHHDKAGE